MKTTTSTEPMKKQTPSDAPQDSELKRFERLLDAFFASTGI